MYEHVTLFYWRYLDAVSWAAAAATGITSDRRWPPTTKRFFLLVLGSQDMFWEQKRSIYIYIYIYTGLDACNPISNFLLKPFHQRKMTKLIQTMTKRSRHGPHGHPRRPPHDSNLTAVLHFNISDEDSRHLVDNDDNSHEIYAFMSLSSIINWLLSKHVWHSE